MKAEPRKRDFTSWMDIWRLKIMALTNLDCLMDIMTINPL